MTGPIITIDDSHAFHSEAHSTGTGYFASIVFHSLRSRHSFQLHRSIAFQIVRVMLEALTDRASEDRKDKMIVKTLARSLCQSRLSCCLLTASLGGNTCAGVYHNYVFPLEIKKLTQQPGLCIQGVHEDQLCLLSFSTTVACCFKFPDLVLHFFPICDDSPACSEDHDIHRVFSRFLYSPYFGFLHP
mmetsp:Transcript_19909/g.38440  ORF Transcript_19909/g.38440 Transcript_19909/m.38440 type:complete len:187 (-) Transcript_19909:239-799(-)